MASFFKKSGQKFTKKLVKTSKKTLVFSKKHLEKNLTSRFSHIKNVRLLIFEWILLMIVIISLSLAQSFWQADSYKTSTFTSGGNYTEGTLGDVSSMNPIFATTSSEKTLSKLLFATISAPDYSGHMGLDLAESIKTDDSSRAWVIKLRDNIFWSDGMPITAKDIIYTTKIIQDPKINTAYASGLSGVKVEEKNGNIIFRLPSASSNFASALNFPVLPSHILADVSAEKLIEHNFSNHPVTSGPFIFKASQISSETGNKVFYLTANARYFKGEPLLNNFSIHTFSSTKDIINSLNSGAITATAELSAKDQKKVTNAEIYQKQTALSSGAFAFLNTTSVVFRNHNLRKALRLGLDMRSLRAPLEEEAIMDLPLISENVFGLTPPNLPGFDSIKAKELIAANYRGEAVRIATIGTGYLPALAENLNFQLKNLGFKTEMNIYESTQDFLLSILKPRNYDVLIYEIELGSDADLFAYYHSSAANASGLNLSNYKNVLVDDLILAARSTSDEKLRSTKYHALLEYWLEDVPAIGIYRTNLSYYFNKNVRTFSEDNRLVYPTDRFLDINFWATHSVMKNRTP